MYKQKNLIGNLNNVGYCKDKYHCLYNIMIMEEKNSVIAAGVGASSKIVGLENKTRKKIYNYKSIKDYIYKIDNIIMEKKEILEK